VYWLVYLDSYSKEDRRRLRIARRLLIGSAEDGHQWADGDVVNQFPKVDKSQTDLLYLAAEAVRI